MIIRVLSLLALSAGLSSSWAGTFQVVDLQGQPLTGAKVLIGTAPGQPFAGNELTTNDKGEFAAPAAWKTALPVTIEGADLVRTTQYDVAPQGSKLTVSRADGDQKISIQGKMTDFGNIRTDGKVDVGVFIPAVPMDQLIYFDVGWMVSPESDTISVIGQQVAIPSNLSLPNQTESYIFPITLNKPEFRMFVRRPGNYKFLALHAQFPLKRVVDDARAGAPPYDLINYGTLIDSGVVDLSLDRSVNNLSVPVNKMTFDQTVSVQAPALNSDDVVLSVAFSQLDGSNELVPSDVKRLRNNQAQAMKAPATKSGPKVMSVWLKETKGKELMGQPRPLTDEDLEQLPIDLFYKVFAETSASAKVDYRQVSLALHESNGKAPQFLNLVTPPQVSGTKITMVPPSSLNGVTPLRTLVIYSSIKQVGSDKLKAEQRTRLWELSTSGWVEDITLPNLSSPTGNGEKYRWEVMYIGTTDGNISHVTRNATDI